MMRGPHKTASVVRGTEKIETQVTDNSSVKDKFPVLKLPFLRGVVNFVESMSFGGKALTWSAEFFPEGEDAGEPSKFDLWLEKKGKAGEKVIMGFAMVLGVILAIGLFTVLPTFIGSLLAPYVGSGFLRNLCETLLRMVILVGYMLAVSQMKDIQRVFSYHGAEHKTIACYESGEELTVDNVRRHSRFHPRCGTSFLLTVVIISMLVFLLFTLGTQLENAFVRVLVRLAMLPFVVMISYEVNRLVGKYDNFLTRFLRQPGLWLQCITTREPDDSMIEVGIMSLELVIPEEKGEDEWS